MTNKELDRLEKLEKAATPGPWQCDCNQFGTMPTCQPIVRTSNDGDNGVSDRDGIMIVGVGDCGWEDCDGPGFKDADAGLIAALRNSAPALLAAARENIRLRAVVEAAREDRRLLLVVEELADDKVKLQGALERANKYGASADAKNAKLRAVVEAARKLNEGEDEWKALDAALAALDNPTYSPQTNGGANAQVEKGGA